MEITVLSDKKVIIWDLDNTLYFETEEFKDMLDEATAVALVEDLGLKMDIETAKNIVFNSMPGGQLWGMLFFVFMSFAALTTIIAVLENIVAYGIDVLKWTRKKAVTVNFVLVFLLSLPCALGFNVLSGIQPFGPGSMILDLEDFIVSNNLLPLGSMVFLFFCCYKRGWGWDNFIAEADTGKGLMFPKGLRLYVKYVLPFIVFFVFVQGYIDKFFK